MKYALVTGGGRGLGKGFVDYLVGGGYFVFVGVRRLKPEYKNTNSVEYLTLDVADDRSIVHAAKSISSKCSSLDLLINNAGVNKDSASGGHKEYVCNINDLRRNLLLDMFEINAIGPLIVIQKFLFLLKSSPSFVINISSCRASFHDEFENNNPNYGYAASKIALNMFTYGLSKELPKNVKVFSVHPGDVRTDMNKEGSQLPYDQAEKIMEITKNWQDEFNGKFMRWSGEPYRL